MTRAETEKSLSEAIALLKRIQDSMERCVSEPHENARELGKGVVDRETTAVRIVELCAAPHSTD